MPPLVSVIVTFLDARRFLCEAVDSVLTQSDRDWELVLVDDGSTDGSTEIARDYAAKWPARIRYLQHAGHANLGISASRNLGNRHAVGRYLAYLDADDVWTWRKLEEQTKLLEARPDLGFVYGPAKYWQSWQPDAPPGVDRFQDLGVPPGTVLRPPRLIQSVLVSEEASPIGALIRRDLVQRIGGFEDTFRDLYEDQVFYAKLGCHAGALVTDAVWYWYRANPDSVCARAFGERRYWRARTRYLRWLRGYLALNGSSEVELERVVRDLLRAARVGALKDGVWRLGRVAFSRPSARPPQAPAHAGGGPARAAARPTR